MGVLTRWTTALVWTLLAAALVVAGVFAARWQATERINAMIGDRSIEKLTPLPSDPRALYAVAWNLERSQHLDEAARLLTDVQATRESALASQAWFALGNTYFEAAIKASRGLTEDAPSVESAEFDLARDAYRAALRIDPELHGVRYNLELLERLAPTHAGEGWRRNTDPVAIQADRHNGWTTIQESGKRGLP